MLVDTLALTLIGVAEAIVGSSISVTTISPCDVLSRTHGGSAAHRILRKCSPL